MPPERSELTRAFAATYSGADPWEAVERYRQVINYAAANPEKGSSAIATATDVPRGTVRGWTENGSKPDVVRGLETGEHYGWFDVDDTETQYSLAVLSAWVLSSGSIAASTYVPQFVANTDDERTRLSTALDELGLDYTIKDREQNSAGERRATEVTIDDAASVLGRVLAAYGTPVGEKAHQQFTLPSILDDASRTLRLIFAATYVRNRAGERMVNGSGVQFREERSDEYLKALTIFFAEVTRAETSLSESNIWLSADAVDILRSVPLTAELDDEPDNLDPRRPEVESALIEEMHRIAEIVDQTPRYSDLETHATLPPGRFRDAFGSLTMAQVAAGLPPTKPSHLPEEFLLAELEAVCEEAGETVTARAFNERSLLTAQTYSYVFGSWNDALREIGREPNLVHQRDDVNSTEK